MGVSVIMLLLKPELVVEHPLCTSGFTLIKIKGKTPHVIRPENDKSKKKGNLVPERITRFDSNAIDFSESDQNVRGTSIFAFYDIETENSNKSASNYSTI